VERKFGRISLVHFKTDVCLRYARVPIMKTNRLMQHVRLTKQVCLHVLLYSRAEAELLMLNVTVYRNHRALRVKRI